jgi:WS/DGAT/MGAT family acyltransferase
MARPHYERLSALDASFLEIETENAPMHVGAVAVFGPGPLTGERGGVDIERFRHFVESVLHPRYRQRVARMPVSGAFMWVDDAAFNLHYHIRHLRLPEPGDERLLKRLAGHVMSLPLDRNRPLWELWLVEGLEKGGFAVLTKAHHAMIDGVGSADLLTASMQLEPTGFERSGPEPGEPGAAEAPPEPRRWVARPEPGALDLLLGEAGRRAEAGAAAVRAARDAVRHPRRSLETLGSALQGVGQALGSSLHRTSYTPFNVEIGPHRRFDWLDQDLDEVKAIKNALGGTVNDVVLANVSGALRRFLNQRGEDPDALDFRAMVPVNVRAADESGKMGNRVSTVAVQLPLNVSDPRARLARVIERTQAMKDSKQAAGMETIEGIGDWGFGSLFVQLARFTAVTRPFNLVVTNVPGPQIQAYMLGSPLEQVHPLVPLFRNQALGIALFSYNGGLYWGFNADWDALPDLHDLVGHVAADFEALRRAARG